MRQCICDICSLCAECFIYRHATHPAFTPAPFTLNPTACVWLLSMRAASLCVGSCCCRWREWLVKYIICVLFITAEDAECAEYFYISLCAPTNSAVHIETITLPFFLVLPLRSPIHLNIVLVPYSNVATAYPSAEELWGIVIKIK